MIRPVLNSFTIKNSCPDGVGYIYIFALTNVLEILLNLIGVSTSAADKLLQTVMIAIKHGRDSSHLVREKAQIQLGVALLHHASQQAGGVDATRRFVNGASITTHFLLVAGRTLALDHQLFAQLEVGTLVDGRQGLGTCLGTGQRS